MKNSHLNCPNCGHEIDVNSLVLEQAKEKAMSEVSTQMLEKHKTEKKELEQKLRKELSEETSAQIESYKADLLRKSEEVKNYNKLKAEYDIIKLEKENIKESIEAESKQKLVKELSAAKLEIKNELQNQYDLKFNENNLLVEQLKGKLIDAQKRLEQGSMQRQGEAQEILIEDYLRQSFIYDIVEPIKKGAYGADSLLQVSNTQGISGGIYIESKRTQAFSISWIDKFKNDMLQKNATIGVIVTETMPKDMERMGQIDGIWVCSLEEFKSLIFVLREAIVMISEVKISETNKDSKMERLYGYLTSNQFKLQVQSAIEGLVTMETELAAERRSFESIWKKREKQIQRVCLNVVGVFSSVKGIAGAEIENIPALELPINTNENE